VGGGKSREIVSEGCGNGGGADDTRIERNGRRFIGNRA